MISEEQLKCWEERCDTWEFGEMEAHEVVPLLIAEVRSLQKLLYVVSDTGNKILDDNNRLEKEADWLAKQLDFFLQSCPFDMEIHNFTCDNKTCVPLDEIQKCWREAARKATGNK